MPTPQDYVNAFRNKSCAAAIDFIYDCFQKVSAKVGHDATADECIPFVIKKLSETDFGINNNYRDNDLLASFNNIQLKGACSYSQITLVSAMTYLISLSKVDRLALYDNPNMKHPRMGKLPPEGKVNYIFNDEEKVKLVNSEYSIPFPLTEEINKQIYEEIIRFNNNNPFFTAESIDDYPFKKQALAEAEAEAEAKSKKTNQLLTIVEEYFNHLAHKMKDAGYILDKNSGSLEFKGIKTEKIKKLERRYKAVLKLKIYLDEKKQSNGLYLGVNRKDQKKIIDTVNFCRKHKPDWMERSFIQKITDIISLGTKALARSFFSQEKTYRKNLVKEGLCSIAPTS